MLSTLIRYHKLIQLHVSLFISIGFQDIDFILSVVLIFWDQAPLNPIDVSIAVENSFIYTELDGKQIKLSILCYQGCSYKEVILRSYSFSYSDPKRTYIIFHLFRTFCYLLACSHVYNISVDSITNVTKYSTWLASSLFAKMR